MYIRTGRENPPWHLLEDSQDFENTQYTLNNVKTVCGRDFQAMLCEGKPEVPQGGRICQQCEPNRGVENA